MTKSKMQPLLWMMILLTTLTTQCATPQATQAPVAEEKVLKVGVLSPFTGPSIMIGEQAKNAVTMAFEKIDYQIGDYQIELVWMGTNISRDTFDKEKLELCDKCDNLCSKYLQRRSINERHNRGSKSR